MLFLWKRWRLTIVCKIWDMVWGHTLVAPVIISNSIIDPWPFAIEVCFTEIVLNRMMQKAHQSSENWFLFSFVYVCIIFVVYRASNELFSSEEWKWVTLNIFFKIITPNICSRLFNFATLWFEPILSNNIKLIFCGHKGHLNNDQMWIVNVNCFSVLLWLQVAENYFNLSNKVWVQYE